MIEKNQNTVKSHASLIHPLQVKNLSYWTELEIISVNNKKTATNDNYYVIELFVPRLRRRLIQHYFEFAGKSRNSKRKSIKNILAVCNVESADKLVGCKFCSNLILQNQNNSTFIRTNLFKSQTGLGSISLSAERGHCNVN